MLNKVILLGRTTRDLELLRTNNDTAVVNFTIAVDNPSKSNEDRTTSFINCVAFNNTAELMAKYVTKGKLIGIDGRLQTRSYSKKDGTKAVATEVVVNAVTFVDGAKKDEEKEEPKQPAKRGLS